MTRAVLLALLLCGCATVRPVRVAEVPPPANWEWHLRQQPDGTWRYERWNGEAWEGSWRVGFRPQPWDTRQAWRQRSTLELY